MRTRTKRFFIEVNPVGSKFAKALQQGLQAKVNERVLRTNNARGRSHFQVTQRALNKIEQLRQFVAAGVCCPKWTTDSNAVTRNDLGRVVFARTLINSTNGRGILEINLEDENNVIPNAPLYTAYIPKKAEYRVHVFNGEVIDIQQKKKRRGFEGERDTRIRNSNNGYVYCRDGINPPDGITTLAINAVKACNYQYGAVDIIYNEKQDKCFVLEVNSRPGLMGTTLDKYVNAIIKTFNLQVKS